MNLTLSRLAELADGDVVRGTPELLLAHIVTDSRAVIGERSIFVALRGEHFDAHDFLSEAAAHGAVAAIVDRGRIDAAAAFDHVIAVEDTIAALQRLAERYRASFDGVVVGITGSNGKTIVKEMLAQIAGRVRTTYRSPGSYNSQIGVPLALFGMRPEHDLAVIEAGISRPGEMSALEAMIQPDVGVITNIGMAHAAGFGDLATTTREKLLLFERTSGVVVYNADAPHLDSDSGLLARREEGRAATFGESEGADYRITSIVPRERGFEFSLRLPDDDEQRFELNVPGRHNVWNAAAAIATAHVLGVDPGFAREALAAFELAEMRMEMHTTESDVTLLNDAYSSDPVSAAAAVNALVHYAAGARTIAILGDMLDLGVASEAAHTELGQLVQRVGVDHLVCVGARARTAGRAAVERGMPLSNVWDVESTEGLDELLGRIVEPGDWVLFKGSRAVGLERAAASLLESMAPARLYVDLEKIRQNVHSIRRQIGSSTRLMAVVKSFGYGNDSNRVSLTLVHAGVDAFCVAYPDEGIPLRRHGITLPILVTNVRPSEVDKIAKYDLTALTYDEALLDALEAEAARRDKAIDVHVEIDTGMNRLGVEPEHAVRFCQAVADRPHLDLAGVMTHFAAADDAAEDEFTRGQITLFDRVLQDLRAASLEPPLVHAANTAAAWRFPEARYDMVRVGLGLYGVHPSSDVHAATCGVAPALQFVTEVLFVKDVQPGESVGYGRTFVADEHRRIATVAVGYNDGFPRFMSNGGEVLVRGRRCRVVGNVCMDVSMVDVTGVPNVKAGDEVVLFGSQAGDTISIEEIAARGGTINYEILTNISARVRRVFRR